MIRPAHTLGSRGMCTDTWVGIYNRNRVPPWVSSSSPKWVVSPSFRSPAASSTDSTACRWTESPPLPEDDRRKANDGPMVTEPGNSARRTSPTVGLWPGRIPFEEAVLGQEVDLFRVHRIGRCGEPPSSGRAVGRLLAVDVAQEGNAHR